MDLSFNTEQQLLRKSVAEFLARECPFDEVRNLEESIDGYSADMWKKMAKLGWMELFLPEDYGGLGDPFFSVAILMEEMGKKAVPSPYFTTAVQSLLILLEGGTESQRNDFLPKIIAGDVILSLALYEGDGSYYTGSLRMTADMTSDGYRLNGTKLFVMDANIAEYLIVAAGTDAGITLFLVNARQPGIVCQKMKTIGKDNNCVVDFSNIDVSNQAIIGAAGEGESILQRTNTRATLAKSAEMLGGCDTALKMATEYAKQRVQYGTPIGGFQVIQHYLADMKTAYDTTLFYYYRVAWMVDQGMACQTEVSALKARVNEVYKYITERAVQIHGGVGTTREFNIGLFYRRAKASEFAMGDTAYHFNIIAKALAL